MQTDSSPRNSIISNQAPLISPFINTKSEISTFISIITEYLENKNSITEINQNEIQKFLEELNSFLKDINDKVDENDYILNDLYKKNKTAISAIQNLMKEKESSSSSNATPRYNTTSGRENFSPNPLMTSGDYSELERLKDEYIKNLTLLQQYEEQLNEYNTIKKSFNQLQDEYTQLKFEETALRSEYEIVIKDKEQLKSKLEKYINENEKMKELIEQYQSMILMTEKEKNKIKNNAYVITNRFRYFENKITTQEQLIDKFKNDIKKLVEKNRKEKFEYEVKLENYNKTIQELEFKIEEMNEEKIINTKKYLNTLIENTAQYNISFYYDQVKNKIIIKYFNEDIGQIKSVEVANERRLMSVPKIKDFEGKIFSYKKLSASISNNVFSSLCKRHHQKKNSDNSSLNSSIISNLKSDSFKLNNLFENSIVSHCSSKNNNEKFLINSAIINNKKNKEIIISPKANITQKSFSKQKINNIPEISNFSFRDIKEEEITNNDNKIIKEITLEFIGDEKNNKDLNHKRNSDSYFSDISSNFITNQHKRNNSDISYYEIKSISLNFPENEFKPANKETNVETKKKHNNCFDCYVC